MDKKAYAILTQKSEVLPTVREEENKQLEIAASLSDVDNSQDRLFYLAYLFEV